MPGAQRAGKPLHAINAEFIRAPPRTATGLLKRRAVLDRAGDIFVADLCDRARDFRFRVVGEFNDRQPGGRRHEAEQEKCIFQGRRTFLRQGGRQRNQPVEKVSCGLRPRQPAIRKHGLAQFRRDVRINRNEPSPPLEMKGKRRRIVSDKS